MSDWIFDKSKSGKSLFDYIFIGMFILAGVWFLAIVCLWIFVGATVVKAADEVQNTGLKPMLERLWCGQGGCK